MKIALVMPTHFDIHSVIAGGERYAYGLAKALSRKAEVTLFTFGQENRVERDEQLTIQCCRTLFEAGGITNPFSFGHLKNLGGFDVVHCLQYKTVVTELAILQGAIRKQRIFVTDLAGSAIYSFSRLFSFERWVSEFLLISDFNRELNKNLKRPSRIILGGVDCDYFHPASEKKRPRRFVYVGRIFFLKGVHHLIDALPPDAELDIIGRCYEPDYLDLLKKESKGKKVNFLDSLKDEEVLGRYHEAIATVLPSLVDGGFTTAMESMACGVPVIGTRLGSLPEVVMEGKTGFLVPSGSVTELREKMEFFLKNSGHQQSMGFAAREDALNRFTWEKVAERCLRAYRGET